jgi:hypothetical protein
MTRWMNVRKVDCKGGKWMELTQNRVQWRPLVLSFRVLLPEGYVVTLRLFKTMYQLQKLRGVILKINTRSVKHNLF